MSTETSAPRPKWQRAVKNRGFLILAVLATAVSVMALGVLLTAIVLQGHDNLIGLDWDKVAEAREPEPPVEMFELADANWDAVAAELGEPALASLRSVDWSAVTQDQGIEFADQIGDVDWAVTARTDESIDPAALATVDWPAVVDLVRVPGRTWLGAVWSESELGHFATSPPSRRPAKAGIGPALAGTIWICTVCGLAALPLGVGTAIFLEEFKPKRRVARTLHSFIQLNISNLAGVPSIVYGIIGLTAFVQMFGLVGNLNAPTFTLGTRESWYYIQLPFGRGVLAGGLTLMLVILPIVIISAQEALRAVPGSLREGSLALGATRLQMIRRMTLPAAIPGIMTGAILAMSRAIGEAAPVLIICGIVFIRFTPQNVMDEFTALPLQIFDWAGRPQEAFHAVAASGIIILLLALLTFNAVAIVIRQKFQRPLQ